MPGIKLTLEGEKIYPLIVKTVNQYFMVMEKVKEIRGLETGIGGLYFYTGTDKDRAIDFGFVNPKAVSGLEIMELKEGEMLARV